MGQAGQIPHNHAEAVIQGHWNTQSVMLAKAHARTHLQTVIQDIEMTQGRAFRGARGAASKLNVYCIIRLQSCGNLGHTLTFSGAAHAANLIKIEHALGLCGTHTYNAPQMRGLGGR